LTIDEAPDSVTRIPLTPGAVRHSDADDPDVGYGGVCPKEHPLGEHSADATEAECTECGKAYRIKDEKHNKLDRVLSKPRADFVQNNELQGHRAQAHSCTIRVLRDIEA
jgi:hypothetical protein